MIITDLIEGELIRSRKNLEIFMVLKVSTNGVYIANMLQKHNPAYLQFIFPGQVNDFDRDIDIDSLEQWQKDIIAGKKNRGANPF